MLKVLRNKVYEPRHWFALTPLCVVAKVEPEEPSIGEFAFAITTASGHRFDCYTSGERESTLSLQSFANTRLEAPGWTASDERCSLAAADAPFTPGSTVASPEEEPSTPVTPITRRATSANKRHSLPAIGHSVSRAERGLDYILSSASFAQARNYAKINGGHARKSTSGSTKEWEQSGSISRSPSASSVTPPVPPIPTSRPPMPSRPSSSSGKVQFAPVVADAKRPSISHRIAPA
ncbi:hypothetical protein BKA62DRAFT_775600 [Auriculariales sp. MPI-PUGE-AT-0066]|nr:hypothetical protein BKA62DRAFT_775600 [Auriculariales sp. MPI-PUGE-AT-0066]